ncbi:MAG: glycosyltransferase family 4 protein [Bacteroidales bacterium]|nr:glycosyltransferase family 4 protein [Candidatus Latescibacterota bacterium]
MPEIGKSRKVLYHLRTQGSGSEGIHVRGLVKAFRSLGYGVDFIWPLGEGDPTVRAGDNPYDRKRRKSAVELIIPFIPGPVFAFMEYCYNFWAHRRFCAAMKHEKYDFIYERHFFFSWASGAAAKKFGVPLVVEVNEIAGFERVRGNHLSGLARRCEHSLFRNATVISVVSTFLKEKILEQYPDIDREKIHVIPNGVDEDFFANPVDGIRIRKELGIEDKIVFGFIGFFLHVKTWHALEWFLPIFIEAAKDYDKVVLLLVGDGPGRENLEEIGRSMGFEDRMIFPGAVTNNKIGDYIDAMDVGVIPHTNEYRSPIKLFEYMAYGKPILAPAQEPVESVIGSIQEMYLFETKSAESLKNTVAAMIADRQNWPEAGKRLKKLTISSFTYKKHGETILHLLKREGI